MAGNHLFFYIALFMLSTGYCRKHQINLDNDERNFFPISTFGFLEDGKLQFQLNRLSFYSKFHPLLGFTLIKADSSSFLKFSETQENSCLINDVRATRNISVISFFLDLTINELLVSCSNLFLDLEIKSTTESSLTDDFHESAYDLFEKQKQSISTVHNKAFGSLDDDRNMDDVASTFIKGEACRSFKFPFKSQSMGLRTKISDLLFIVSLNDIDDIGLYRLYFHNCPAVNAETGPINAITKPVNSQTKLKTTPVNLSVSVIETNGGSYLSANQMPLIKLYLFMSGIYFAIGCIWIVVLQKKRKETLKIHCMMGLLVFLKSFALLFNGVDYHVIAMKGYIGETWETLYQVTQSLYTALLYITIVLIGAGWNFIKDILSIKDKIVLMLIILLQILANVVKILLKKNGYTEHYYVYKEIIVSADLICCGVILFPTVWTVLRIQKTFQRLEKIKTFIWFFVLIMVYIFCVKIIKISVSFQYEWLLEFGREAVTLIIFFTTGINFRPTAKNTFFDLCKSFYSTAVPDGLIQIGLKGNVPKTVEPPKVVYKTKEGPPTKEEQSKK